MSKFNVVWFLGLLFLAGALGWALVYWPLAVLGLAALVFLGIIFYWRTETAFYFLVAYLPFQLALNLAADIDLLSGRVLILLLFLVWLIKIIRTREISIIKNRAWVGAILVLAANFISLLAAQNQIWGARKWLVFASVFPLFFLTSYFINDLKKVKKLLLVIGGSAALAALVALGQFLAQFVWGLGKIMSFWGGQIAPWFLGQTFAQSVTQNPSWLVNLGGQTIMRTIGFFPDPHMLAFFIGLTAPLSLVLMFSENGRRARWLFIVCCLLFAVLLLTFSRGGYLGLAFGLVAMFVFAWPRFDRKEKVFFSSCLILASVIILLAGSPVMGRFFSSFDLAEGSNLGRLAIWQESWTVFKDSPILGVGLGNYPLALDFNANYRSAVTSHNLYLDILAETGLVGLVAWVWFFYSFFAGVIKKIKQRDKEIALLGAGLLGGGIYFLTHAFFETAIFNPTILAYLMIVAGLGVSSLEEADNKG